MKKIFLLGLLSFFLLPFAAQAQQVEECATDALHEKLMSNDPDYAARFQTNRALVQQYAKNNRNLKSGTVLEIPVVVHIVHTGEPVGTGANISMTQINSAITRMNDRYRNVHGTSVDTEIEFVLAKRDPNGNATTGVNRVDGSVVPGYDTAGLDAGGGVGASDEAIKNLSRWPNTNYYNVWVVTEIDDNDGLFGIQGYAYFPGARPAIDGTIIMHTCFGTTGTVNSFNNQGRTLVHELGHGLNLYHTFQGDADGTVCPSGLGDEVADTDPHIRASSNCPSGTNSCTGGSIDGVTKNIMNYSSQTCAKDFTAGQSTRMRAAILALRPGLTTSLGGTNPASSYLGNPSCTPSTVNPSNAFGIGILGFSLNGFSLVSDYTANEGDYIDHTKHQLISLDIDSTYSINVETGRSNDEDVEVYIDFNDDGDFLDAGENVFSSSQAMTHSGNITMPSTGTSGPVRLRVISDWHSNTITGPCYNPDFGQTEDYAVEVVQPASPLLVSLSALDASCFGSSDGSISASVSGGSSPYTFLWSSGSTSQTNTNLSAGSYTLTVTDALGSTKVETAAVNEPSMLVLSTSSTPDSCFFNNGTASVMISGGVSPYVTLWSNGVSNSTTITGLFSNNYFTTVTDANGCSATGTATVVDFCAPVLPAPQNLTERGLSDVSAKLLWDTIGAASSYRIAYRAVGNPNWTVLFRQINLGFMPISSLSSSTNYEWRVQARFGSNWGPFSNLKQFTTLSGPCAAAINYFESRVKADRALLNWTPDAQAVRQKLRYRMSGSPTWIQTVVGAPRTAYFLTGLMSGTNYEWQINTTCQLGTSGVWGPVQTFTTTGAALRKRFDSQGADNKWAEVSLYPNPSQGYFVIQMPSRSETTQIEVLDLQGRLVFAQELGESSTSENVEMHLVGLSPGVYLIQIRDSESQFQEKLVIH